MALGILFLVFLIASGYGYYEYQQPDQDPYPVGVFKVSEQYEITRSRGWPNQEQFQFDAYSPGDHYQLRIHSNKASTGAIYLNSQRVINSWDLKRHRDYYEKDVSLLKSNNITLSIAGKPGSSYTAEVVGFDDELPSIEHTITPKENKFGWHKQSVKITWQCKDEISGILNCSEVALLEHEGKNQTVEGTAEDNAKNTASKSLTINIDLTPPQITTELSHEANEFGWYNKDVQLTFLCSDELSGVNNCQESVLQREEGKGIEVKAVAEDLAFNQNQSVTTVNLDKTPPILSASYSASPNQNNWYNQPVSIFFDCSDNLSGVEQCAEPILLLEEGYNQIAQTHINDLAFNNTEYTKTFNIDFTPPIIQFKDIPQTGLVSTPALALELLLFDNLKLDFSQLSIRFDNALVSCERQGALVECPSVSLSSANVHNISARIKDMAGNPISIAKEVALDLDEDDIADYLDQCANTPKSENANASGCSYSQRDDDGDGVSNGIDQCPNTGLDVAVEGDGCDSSQRDTDGDGVVDVEDDFPLDSGEFKDTDNDGVGDNTDDDIDGDGFSNIEEEQAGSDPSDKTSIPALQFTHFNYSTNRIESDGSPVLIEWISQGATKVEYTSDFTSQIIELAREGNIQLFPEVSTDYTFTALGPNGQVSKNLRIEVALPEPKTLWPQSVKVDLLDTAVNTSLTLTSEGESYFGDYDGNYNKLSNNGQVLWQIQNLGVVTGKALINQQTQNMYLGVDSSDNASNASEGHLVKVNAAGKVQWKLKTQNSVIAQPTYYGNHLVLIDYRGVIYKVNDSGKLISSFALGDMFRFSEAIQIIPNTGLATVLSREGQLYKLDLESMSIVWQKSLVNEVKGTGK